MTRRTESKPFLVTVLMSSCLNIHLGPQLTYQTLNKETKKGSKKSINAHINDCHHSQRHFNNNNNTVSDINGILNDKLSLTHNTKDMKTSNTKKKPGKTFI